MIKVELEKLEGNITRLVFTSSRPGDAAEINDLDEINRLVSLPLAKRSGFTDTATLFVDVKEEN